MKRSFKQGKIRLNPDKTKPGSGHSRTPYYSPALRRMHLNSSGCYRMLSWYLKYKSFYRLLPYRSPTFVCFIFPLSQFVHTVSFKFRRNIYVHMRKQRLQEKAVDWPPGLKWVENKSFQGSKSTVQKFRDSVLNREPGLHTIVQQFDSSVYKMLASESCESWSPLKNHWKKKHHRNRKQ